MPVIMMVGVMLLGVPLCGGEGGDNLGKQPKLKKNHITFDQLPGPVQTTAMKYVTRQRITDVERLMDGNKKVVFYRIESKKNRQEEKVDIAPDGKLIRITTESEEGE